MNLLQLGSTSLRRRKLLIRCSICGLILSPCTLRWRDLHKTWRNLPGHYGPQCIKDPARCMYRRRDYLRVSLPSKTICLQWCFINSVKRELWFILIIESEKKKTGWLCTHTCSQSWWDKGRVLEFRSKKSTTAGFHWTSIVWHFLVFCLLCSCLMYPCVNIYMLFLEWVRSNSALNVQWQ